MVMCTSIIYRNGDSYFGRNLDLEYSYNEEVVITPRKMPFHFRMKEVLKNHYACIGMATVVDDIPLYYEAANEKGLAMAGLNFPGNAVYHMPVEDKDNIAPFELIPWILGQCANVQEARKYLSKINLVNISFCEKMPLAPLHWIISDDKESIIVESMEDGLYIYEDKIGVLTNNPPYEYHRWNINNYQHLSPKNSQNEFSKQLDLNPYAQGMGAIGLPGDFSSASRFVKAAFLLNNAVSEKNENANVSQFFHILDGVAMVKGSVITPQGHHDITVYSCCINLSKGIYYYKTYENNQISAISLFQEDLEDTSITRYPLIHDQQFYYVQ